MHHEGPRGADGLIVHIAHHGADGLIVHIAHHGADGLTVSWSPWSSSWGGPFRPHATEDGTTLGFVVLRMVPIMMSTLSPSGSRILTFRN